MNRTLVWPWHGLVRGSFVHLPNGDTLPYDQPLGLQTAIYGPGDTHLISVKGIEPITPEEAASAPPGGHYWDGQALITGASLYNRSFQGWMYQAEDGSRWRASLIAGTINAGLTNVRVTLTRFGEFGVAAESFTTLLVAPVGQADDNMRRKLSGNLGFPGDEVVRLHSFSPSGKTAILAWSLFNRSSDRDAQDVDVRPRAYTFYKISLERTETAVLISGEVLYSFDDVYSEDRSESGTPYSRFGNSGALGLEIDRKPIIRDGKYLGDTVTYDFSPVVEVISGDSGNWNGPSSLEVTRRWMVMVVFDNETVRPCYLNFHDTYARGEASFTGQTLSPKIIEEYTDGTQQIIDDGKLNITGGGFGSGQGAVTWEGPGAEWSRTNNYSVSSSWDHGNLSVVAVDGEHVSSEVYEDTRFIMWTDSGASFGGFGGSLPNYQAGGKRWSLVFYSNNLIAVTSVDVYIDQTERVEGVITSKGYQAVESIGVLPADMRHYGSYNPATEEFIILSPDKVNWV